MNFAPDLKTTIFFDSEPFHIQNDGPKITYTDYWTSLIAKKSYYFLSCHEMCFRLLIPQSRYVDIKDIRTGAEVLLTYGFLGYQKSIEILFEDHTETPFSLHIAQDMSDIVPAISLRDRKGQLHKWLFKAYSENGLIHEAPARLRFKKKLPYLKPWKD